MSSSSNIYRLFPDPPVLTGDRICLRPLTLSDKEGLRKLTSQEDVYQMLPAILLERKYLSEEQAAQFDSDPIVLKPWDPMGSLA